MSESHDHWTDKWAIEDVAGWLAVLGIALVVISVFSALVGLTYHAIFVKGDLAAIPMVGLVWGTAAFVSGMFLFGVIDE